MSFIDKIRSVVEQMNGAPPFIGGSWYKLNHDVEHAPLPCVMWVTPASGTFEAKAIQILDSPNCLIAFFDKTDFIGDFEDDSAAMETTKAMAAEFIARCNASGLFDQIKDSRYSAVMDKFDVNAAGIVLEVSIKEKQGMNICNYAYIDTLSGTTYAIERDPLFQAWVQSGAPITQYSIINGAELPAGVQPDILRIDTGIISADHSIDRLDIVKPDGYVFSKCYLDTFTNALTSLIIRDSEGVLNAEAGYIGKWVILPLVTDLIIDGNLQVTCGKPELATWRAIFEFERSVL